MSQKGRDAVEALRAKLKLTNVPVDAATRAVRDDEGAREVVRLCVDWDGRMARLRQLHKDFDTLRQPGLNPAALIWDMPPPHRGAARRIETPNIVHAGGAFVRAQHVPPQRMPRDDRSSDVVDVTVGARPFGGDAELLESFMCRLHVPGLMKNRLWADEEDASGAAVDASGLAVQWMFTCSYGGAQKVTVRLNRERAMAPLEQEQYVQVLMLRPRDASPADRAAFDEYLRCWYD